MTSISGTKSRRIEREVGQYFVADSYLRDGRPALALRSFRRILDQKPKHAAARRGLAAALTALGHARAASLEQRKATQLEVQDLLALGDDASEQGYYAVAAQSFRRVVELDPMSGRGIWGLAESLRRNGQKAESLRWYRRYQALHPGEPESAHMAAALGGRAPPRRASDAYVKSVFDWFADDFDRKLIEDLDYKAPDALLAAVRRVLGQERASLDVLDLGCGTGLVGVKFRGLARRLEGVDLSPRMLRHARRRRVYDRLRPGDMIAELAVAQNRYDLIVAADVFCYVGDLGPVICAAARALRRGGLFAFTVERRKARGFGITSSGRYAHHPDYVRRCGRHCDLVEVLGQSPIVRYEYGAPVRAHLSVMRKT